MFGLRFSRRGAPGAARDTPRGTGGAPHGFRPLARIDEAEQGEAGPGEPAVHMESRAEAADSRPRLGDVFTPSQPRGLGPLFVGRDTYLRRLVSAVEQERAHVVLFGDRGRGKTSLANAFSEVASRAGYVVLRCSCGSSTSFEALFRRLLAGLPAHLAGPAATGTAEPLLPEGRFGATELTDALRRLRGGRVIFLIDEFDRAQDETLRVELAEAVKNVSDAAVPATFFIVGVAQSLDDLLGQHPSIQRNLVALHLTLMTEDETRRLIRAGAAAARIRFADEVAAAVVRFARGMPYYAQLLCLFAARAAGARSSTEVTAEDLSTAVAEVLAKQEPHLGRVYAQAVQGTPGMEDVLYASAMAETDVYGRFTVAAAAAVPLGPARPNGLAPELAAKAMGELAARRCLVSADGPNGTLYGFAEPALAHYVMFRQAGPRRLLPGRNDVHRAGPPPDAPHRE